MTNEPASPASGLVGYCTNVHAGMTLDEVKTNLEKYAIAVRQRVVSDDGQLGVGLWLSFQTTEELLTVPAKNDFRDWLAERHLAPYTVNGFPFGNFHQSVVKREVYQPTWADSQRLEYTCRLADIQSILFAGERSTISTLPLAWPFPQNRTREFKIACAHNLIKLTEYLVRIQDQAGKRIVVCIEPEPGCLFDTAVGLVDYFENFLFANCDAASEANVRKHIGVCHDICHSAVMFESQDSALSTYVNAGIDVAKVQVSSAIEADFRKLETNQRVELLERLQQFAEPRYLHQTSVKSFDEREIGDAVDGSVDSEHLGKVEFFEDLPDAIRSAGSDPRGLWRVHFHVPIFQQRYGLIGSTQSDIGSFLDAIKRLNLNPDLEIETYAWNVLPASLQEETLDQSLTREIEWFQKTVTTE